MPDLVIRDFAQEELDAMKRLASPQSLQGWGKALLLEKLQEPVIEVRYILKAFGPGPTMAFIRRVDNDLSDPREGQTNLSEAQKIAYQKALEFVKRNGPGDRESAISALKQEFETVFETVM
jgi:hypothetical protein